MTHTITIRPEYHGRRQILPEFRIICPCGWEEKAGTALSVNLREQEARGRAVAHNEQRHGRKYMLKMLEAKT